MTLKILMSSIEFPEPDIQKIAMNEMTTKNMANPPVAHRALIVSAMVPAKKVPGLLTPKFS